MLGAVDIVPYMGKNTYRCSCGWHRTEIEMQFLGGDRYKCEECEEIVTRFPPLDWVVAGCESGPKRRRAGEWQEYYQAFHDLKEQCADAGVPFYLKQMDFDGKVVKAPELDGVRHDATGWR